MSTALNLVYYVFVAGPAYVLALITPIGARRRCGCGDHRRVAAEEEHAEELNVDLEDEEEEDDKLNDV